MYTRVIKKNTKKAQELINNYESYTQHNGFIDLWEAYGNPSVYKERAWRDIEKMCADMGGHGLSVLGHNCMKYSAAFKAVENGVEKLFYFTADNTYEVEL